MPSDAARREHHLPHGTANWVTTKPKTRKAQAAGVNPKLIALAAKIDEANAELARVLDEARNPARRLERAANDAVVLAEKRFSAIRATNMDELVFKARQVAKEADEGLYDFRLAATSSEVRRRRACALAKNVVRDVPDCRLPAQRFASACDFAARDAAALIIPLVEAPPVRRFWPSRSALHRLCAPFSTGKQKEHDACENNRDGPYNHGKPPHGYSQNSRRHPSEPKPHWKPIGVGTVEVSRNKGQTANKQSYYHSCVEICFDGHAYSLSPRINKAGITMREILDLAFRQNFDETWMLLRTSPIRGIMA